MDFDLFLDQTSVVEFIHRKLTDCKLAVELDACLHRCLFREFSSISGKLYLREIDGCFFVFQDHTVHSSQIVHCDVHLWRRIFGGVVYNPGGVFVARSVDPVDCWCQALISGEKAGRWALGCVCSQIWDI